MPNKVVETLLTNVGIPAEDIKTILELPEDKQETFDIKPITEKVKTNYETQLKNNADFYNDLTLDKLPPDVKKKLEAAQFGRTSNITIDKVLKITGMTKEELADLPDEVKDKFETHLQAITEKWMKTRGSKDGDKQLQQDLIDARKQLEKYGPDYEKTIEAKYKTQADQKEMAVIFNAALIGELAAIPGLKISAFDIAGTAAQQLQSKYGFAKVGEYGIELRNKTNPELKALKANSSQEITLKEALAEIATERGWIEKKEEGGKGSGTVAVVPGNNGLQMKEVVAPHVMEKLAKKIAAEKS